VSNLKLSNYFIDFVDSICWSLLVEAQHKVLMALKRSSITKACLLVLKGKGAAVHGSGLMATNHVNSFLAAQGNYSHDWAFYDLTPHPAISPCMLGLAGKRAESRTDVHHSHAIPLCSM
jgi:hypothetical protein